MRLHSLVLTLSLACLINAFNLLSSESTTPTQEDTFIKAYLTLKRNVSLENSDSYLKQLHENIIRARNAECIMTENGKFDESLIQIHNLPRENRSELVALFQQFQMANSTIKNHILSILNDNVRI